MAEYIVMVTSVSICGFENTTKTLCHLNNKEREREREREGVERERERGREGVERERG